VTLTLGKMTFIYEFDLYPIKMPQHTRNGLSRPKLSKVIILQTCRHREK